MQGVCPHTKKPTKLQKKNDICKFLGIFLRNVKKSNRTAEGISGKHRGSSEFLLRSGRCYFGENFNKNYIILCIIYNVLSIRKKRSLSYGYLVVMLWLSCGERCCLDQVWMRFGWDSDGEGRQRGALKNERETNDPTGREEKNTWRFANVKIFL